MLMYRCKMSKVEGPYNFSREHILRATERHLPYEIT